MVNINLRVETSSGNDEDSICRNSQNRKPLEENLKEASGISLSDPGSEMINLQRLAVCRLNQSVETPNIGSPRSPPVEEKRHRREIANSNERRRMQSINAGFQSLRALLPRRDGEKISKASILQQTADMLKSLQAEKQLLSQQNTQYKQRLENAGEVPVNSTNLRPGVEPEKPSITVGHPGIIAPPKKRRKFQNASCGDSSDEGLGMLSDGDIGVKDHSPLVGRAASGVPNPPVSSAPGESVKPENPGWETEMLQNELIKLRLALEQERRVRLLLEDQLRAMELSRLQTLGRLPNVPSLLEYSGSLPPVSAGSLLSTSVSTPRQPAPLLYSNSPTTSAIHGHNQQLSDHHTLTAAVPPQTGNPPSSAMAGVNLRGAGNFTTLTTHHTTVPSGHHGLLQQNSHGPLKQSAAYAQVNLGVSRSAMNETLGNSAPPSSNYNSASKQSLNAIVEAIRHLEGDQLFVDDSEIATGQIRQSSRVLTTGMDAMRLDPGFLGGTDSGMSSPVTDRQQFLGAGMSILEPGIVRGVSQGL